MYPGEHAKTRADEPALIMASSGEVVTFRQFEAAANRWRTSIARRACSVSTTSRSSSRTTRGCSSARAAPSARASTTRASTRYLAPDEAAYIINDSEARIVVTSAAKREVAMQLPALCPNVERWLMADIDERRRALREPRGGDARVPRPIRSTTSSSARRCSTRRARPDSRRASCGRCPTCIRTQRWR